MPVMTSALLFFVIPTLLVLGLIAALTPVVSEEEWASAFWFSDKPGICWVCRQPTFWVWADQDYQHKTCDMWPTEEGYTGIAINGITTIWDGEQLLLVTDKPLEQKELS